VLLVPCPWCGPRAEIEFRYGGEAHLDYPDDPQGLTDEEWAAFLFMRTNAKGDAAERWFHAAGCRRWFNAVRNTTSHEFIAAYRIGERAPRAGA
jgi:heterotetrameric sarcosine oxidase delta subunit